MTELESVRLPAFFGWLLRSCGGVSIVALTLAAAMPVAWAQDALRGNHIDFELGGGGMVAPRYEGSSDYLLSPYPIIRLRSLQTSRFSLGGPDTTGWTFAPSFRYLGDREAKDEPILAGIPDVDAALELGLRAGYEWENARVFGALRYGVTGHNGLVGELGADAIWRLSEQTTVWAGPRLSFANEDYMDTYFSVPLTAANLQPFSADGGFKSVGAEILVRHDFNEYWAVEASGQWDHLIGDAGDSPIVKAGDENQFTAKFGIIRKFSIDF